MPSAVPIADPPRTDQTGPDAVGAPPVRTTDGRPGTGNDRHFCTAHLHDDLKGRSVRGGAVTLGAQGVKFALRLVQTVVLARLLAPEAFGLVAMVTVVTGFAGMFKDAGLSMATVQREEITHEQISTLFWINVALSVVLALVVAALAPAIAWLYGDPRLTAITLVLAGTFVLSGLAIQHQALLRRQMRFAALGTIQIITMIASVTAAIVAAVLGAGYWALVWMAIVQSVVGTVLLWGVCGWMPGLPRRRTGVRPMLAFGGNLTGFSFVNYFLRNADNMLIGWFWGAGSLGLYSKAYSLLTLPLSQLNGPIAAVAIPSLSRLQDDPRRFANYYLGMVSLLLTVTSPVIAILTVSADEIVMYVLGPQWHDSARIFQFLAISALLTPAMNSVGWLYTSLNKTDRMFRWGIISSPFIILSFIVGLPFGPAGVALTYSLTVAGLFLPGLWYATAGTSVSLAALLKAVARPIGVSAIVIGAILFLDQIGHLSVTSPTSLVAKLGVFVLIYSILSLGFQRQEIARLARFVKDLPHLRFS